VTIIHITEVQIPLEPPVYNFEYRCLIWLLQPRCHLWKDETNVNLFIHPFIHSFIHWRHKTCLVINRDLTLNFSNWMLLTPTVIIKISVSDWYSFIQLFIPSIVFVSLVRRHSEDFVVTPFAQILQALRRVCVSYMTLTKLPLTASVKCILLNLCTYPLFTRLY